MKQRILLKQKEKLGKLRKKKNQRNHLEKNSSEKRKEERKKETQAYKVKHTTTHIIKNKDVYVERK